MLAGLALGVPASLALARYRFPGREGLSAVLLVPLVVPGVVAGTAIYVFQVEAEILDRAAPRRLPPGLVLAHVVLTIPVDGAAGHREPRRLRPRGGGGGAEPRGGPWTTFRRMTLPLIRPGVVAAALFAFIISFGNLEMTLFLVGPGRTTLPIAILQYLEWRIDPVIAAVSFVQIVVIAAGMIATDRYVKLARVL